MKLNIRNFAGIASAVVALVSGQAAFGQTTDSQTFTVIVPTLVSITAPADETIDTNTPALQVDGPMTFPTGTWACTSNSDSGANVTLTAGSPFLNGAHFVDADLTLALNSPDAGAGWALGTATATTSGIGTTATVSASSTAPGDTGLDLTVVFNNTGAYSDLASGNYVMTVTGTIAGNP